ncbi:hypothetical protein FW774_17305 [Pedobacter sp. BS3]|nr:hypothetical protein FW774_17305 [Pedobacter sp. BS3]
MQKDIWQNHIEENLYKDNAFLSTFVQVDKSYIDGRNVHIPQAGAASAVKKNRTTLPAEVKQRTDTPTSYQINEFTSDPILIPNADTHELSYDKRNSVLREDSAKLAEEVAEDVLLSMVKAAIGTTTALPAGNILSTTGDAVAATAPGATGNRKAYKLGDLQRAQSFFIRKKLWTEGRMYAIITGEAAAQMFPAESQVTATYMAAVSEAERRGGIMYSAYGFKIMVRSTVFVLDNTGAFKPLSAEGAATDNEGIVFYNGNCMEFAMGDVKFFEKTDDPTYYGDVYSFLVRCGARARRENFDGVMVIKQAATA